MSDKRTVYITAVADANEPEGYRFGMVDDKGATLTELEFDKGKSKLKDSQFYLITFELDANDNGGLRFSKDLSKVFWAKPIPNATAPCVTEESHLPGLFVDPATPITDRQIKVINVDRTIQLFAFAFNFLRPGDVDGPGTKYVLYDPVGSNKNGGVPFTQSSAIAVGVGAAVVGALVGTFLIAPAIS